MKKAKEAPEWEAVGNGVYRIEVPGGWIYRELGFVFVPRPHDRAIIALEDCLKAARLARTALEFVVADGDQDLFHDTRECPCDDTCECESKASIEGALKLLNEVLS